mmetsp:Transcript_25540/g.39565  ORF Transcript_25540/g.39565 Transcript_25540/m.39565 type:complete len:1265 (+) Transcript_25540:39-3833(+)
MMTTSNNKQPSHIAVVHHGDDKTKPRVDVYDANGRARSFQLDDSSDNRNLKNGENKKILCFSTHNSGHGIDELLTPCFDEDGLHGTPDEGCFCGRDEPHIHAHEYNPKTCGSSGDHGAGSPSCQKKHAKIPDISVLSRLTLYPVDDNDELSCACCSHNRQTVSNDEQSGTAVIPASIASSCGDDACCASRKSKGLASIPVSAGLPAACNSREVGDMMDRLDANERERIFQVKHEDHVDYLVHNSKTGNIHLEHSCKDCNGTDLHGTLQLSAKRTLNGHHSLHFYDIPTHEFNCMNFFAEFIAIDSDRVNSALNVLTLPEKEPSSCPCCQNESSAGPCSMPIETSTDSAAVGNKTISEDLVRSTLHVSKICCSSEVPAIKAILNHVEGIRYVRINVPNKLVYVDHIPAECSAMDCVAALNKESFGASLRHDGDMKAIPIDNIQHSKYVESTLRITTTKTSSSHTPTDNGGISGDGIPKLVTSVLTNNEAVRFFHTQKLSLHVYTCSIEHDPERVSANDLEEKLNAVDGVSEAFVITDGLAWKLYVPDNTGTAASSSQDTKKSKSIWELMYGIFNGNYNFHGIHPLVALSGICWLVSLLGLIPGLHRADSLKYAAIGSCVFGLPNIALKAFRTIKRCQLDANCLMLTAALGAIAIGELVEAAAVAFLFSTSEYLEHRATHRARKALASIVSLRPERALLLMNDNDNNDSRKVTMVPAHCLTVNMRVLVRTGDKIPCDGTVLHGCTQVNEASITGESRPVVKEASMQVCSGTVNTGASPIVVRVDKSAKDSTVNRLIQLVEEAQSQRSATEQLVDQFAHYYTPLVLLTSLGLATIPWLVLSKDAAQEYFYHALILLVTACPCALVISTPVVYVAGLASCATNGIIVKGGAHLEALAHTHDICMDKTGTMTRGEFVLTSLESFTSDEDINVLQYLGAIQGPSVHPLASAMRAAATAESSKNETFRKQLAELEKHCNDHTNIPGMGVCATILDRKVYCGNARLFESINGTVLSEDVMQRADHLASTTGGTVGFIGTSDDVWGMYCVNDAPRAEAVDVIQKLNAMGYNITMLTGDASGAALAVAQSVGLDDTSVRHSLLPEQKLSFIQSLMNSSSTANNAHCCRTRCRNDSRRNGNNKRQGVVMVGDGVNDAPALATATVGVAMGAGAALAMETSDVTLMDSNLNKLLFVLRIGRKTARLIVQNVVFSIVVKAAVVVLTFVGYTSLWGAIIADVGSMLCVTLNGMRLLASKDASSDANSNFNDADSGAPS